ncbi:MAG: hypothetical protein ACKVUS_22065, partial [Saprospiraceae bacterium]
MNNADFCNADCADRADLRGFFDKNLSGDKGFSPLSPLKFLSKNPRNPPYPRNPRCRNPRCSSVPVGPHIQEH